MSLFSKKTKKADDEIFAVFPAEIYRTGELALKDVLAPSALEVSPTLVRLGAKLARTLFVFSYPRYLHTNWFGPIINLDKIFDVAIFVHPIDTASMLRSLRRKVAEVQSQINMREKKGLVRDPILDTAYRDLEDLRDKLQQASERIFNFGLYLTIYGLSEEELNKTEAEIKSLLEAKLVYTKPALFQQAEGFQSSVPLNTDLLRINTYLNSAPISSAFPFVSFDLTSNKGVLYGINRHNNSLVLFDRFSLPNYNSVIFGTAGGGKSIYGNEQVLIRRNNKVELTPIGPLVNSLIKTRGVTYTDEELEGVQNPDIEVWSFGKNLKGEWSGVTVAARKAAPGQAYHFTTKSGRSIATTADHNVVILKKGSITAEKSSNIKVGDYIPLARSIPGPQSPTNELDLLAIFQNTSGIYVDGASHLLRDRRVELKAKKIDPVYDKYLYNYSRGRVIPIAYFWKIISSLKIENELGQHIKNLYLTSYFRKTRLPARLEVNEPLARIMGYIIAEGTITPTSIIVSNSDQGVLYDLDRALTFLGVSFFYGNNGLVITARPFIKLLAKLGICGHSEAKRVPPLLFNSRGGVQAAFLTAYMEGDGGVDGPKVTTISKSRDLVSDLSYLLLSFGIIARLRKRPKRTPGTNRKRNYWLLSLSGQDNLQKFAKEINFVSARKKALLSSLLGKNENTNVDLVPTVESLLNEIHTNLPPPLRNIPYLNELRGGGKHPSRQTLQLLIAELEKRIGRLTQTTSSIAPLRALPSLASLIAGAKSDQRLNAALWKKLASSWAVIKAGSVSPRFHNVNQIIKSSNGCEYNLNDVKTAIHNGFKELGLSMQESNPSLGPALTDIAENTSYAILWGSAQILTKECQKYLAAFTKIEDALTRLKTLAASDLFWDPITKIEVINRKSDKYVYDLCVDNEVFLAGNGGMFVHNSYLSKLEILRSLMWGIDVIVIDPEREYEYLTQAVGGSYINISLASKNHINPFDLPVPREDESASDVLRSSIVNLIGLFRLMLGGLTPEEDAIMDQAITETYASKDITADANLASAIPPTLSDLELVLASTAGGENLAMRLKKFTMGTWAGFINQPTNIEMKNRLVVFSVRDMEDELRPIGIFLILHYIWNAIRTNLRKRLLVVDEAWWLMKNEDSASFLFGIAKRSRKYFLGLSTITQDVGDFLNSPYGRPIITNSSMQLLLKQSPATIDVVAQTFNLTEEEKFLLLESERGEGIFFAGLKHVALKVMASYTEDQIVTSDPAQLLLIKKAKAEYAKQNTPSLPQK